MAHIAILTSDASNQSPIRLLNALVSIGHTGVIFGNNTSTSLMSFDLIMTTRNGLFSTANEFFFEAFNSGVPVIFGFQQPAGTTSVAGSGANFYAARIGLVSTITEGSNSKNILLFTDTFKSSQSGSFLDIHNNSDFHAYTDTNNIAPSARKLAAPAGQLSNIAECALTIAPRMGENLMGGKFPASCAFAGFIYASNEPFTTQAISLISDIIDEVFRVNYKKTVAGKSFDDSGNPQEATVSIYNSSDNSLFATTTTDVDGSYSFLVNDSEFFVVCDNGNPDNNMLINKGVVGA